jgi:hypothetical protein
LGFDGQTGTIWSSVQHSSAPPRHQGDVRIGSTGGVHMDDSRRLAPSVRVSGWLHQWNSDVRNGNSCW